MSERRTFPVGSGASIDVRIQSGSLSITTGDEHHIVVTVDRPADWDITQVGDVVALRPIDRWRVRSSRLAIEVPPSSRIDVNGASASVVIDGDVGDVDVATASGDCTVRGRCTSLTARSASGDVRVGDVAGDVEAKTASGDADFERVGGRLAVTTASGDVTAASVGGDLTVSTSSGDVAVGRAEGDALLARSMSGRVRIGLPTGIRVKPDLKTMSGRTRLPTPAPDQDKSASSYDRRLVRLVVKTVSGDIDIRRAT